MSFKKNKIFSEKLAQIWLEKIIIFLQTEKILSNNQQVLISIANVSEKEIKNLNNQYRTKNEVTDILSFGYVFDNKKIEGDLVLCWNIIQKNAQEDGTEAEKELVKNLVHGCLHLTGKEHSAEMFKLQEEFLKKFFK